MLHDDLANNVLCFHVASMDMDYAWVWIGYICVVAVCSSLVLAPLAVLRYFQRKYHISEDEAFARMVCARKSVFAWAVTEPILLFSHGMFQWDPSELFMTSVLLFLVLLWIINGNHHLQSWINHPPPRRNMAEPAPHE